MADGCRKCRKKQHKTQKSGGSPFGPPPDFLGVTAINKRWLRAFSLESLNKFAVLWLEASGEEAENFWFVNPFQTADVMSSFIQTDDSVSNVIQMSICINLSLIHISSQATGR